MKPKLAERSGETVLRPRARIIAALGEDLISNSIIALVELIKNAYDADATHVLVRFEPPITPGCGAILVEDDGHGMTLDVLTKAWMEPATTSKHQRRKSPAGRRMTGEKGIGRFAAARLAERMILESIAGSPRRRVSATFDWEAFKKENKYLDEIRCAWHEGDPATKARNGTILRLERLRDEWTRGMLQRLRSELARLVVRSGRQDNFSIRMELPEGFADIGGDITPPPVLGKPHYTLSGSMTEDGHVVAKMAIRSEQQRVDETVKLEGGRTPTCGPFTFELKIWDREREDLEPLATAFGSTIRDLRKDLDDACGVSIYRDGFRVMPYGGPDNDWLRLDLRRVQNPTMRLSNNQIVGSIQITADGNTDLRDQTNREGIVESVALRDLSDSVRELLSKIESARYDLRRKGARKTEEPLFRHFDIAPIRNRFKEKYPQDVEFLRFLEERAADVRSSVRNVQEVIARYRRLATLGQLVDVILHDGRMAVAAISNECELGLRKRRASKDTKSELKKLRKRLETIGAQTEVLASLFRRISPFGGRKRGRPTTRPIEETIADAFAIFHRSIEEMGVRVSLPKTSTPVTADSAEMQQVIVNLLDNALYWIAKVPKAKREIAAEVTRTSDAVEILFADSGPGVPDDARDYIFDPYYSMKPDGVGIGLTIAGEVVAEYDGELELVSPGILPGANFRVVLRRRIGDGGE